MNRYVIYFRIAYFPEIFNVSVLANNLKEALNYVMEGMNGRYVIIEIRKVDK